MRSLDGRWYGARDIVAISSSTPTDEETAAAAAHEATREIPP
jgi:hypothetical protein